MALLGRLELCPEFDGAAIPLTAAQISAASADTSKAEHIDMEYWGFIDEANEGISGAPLLLNNTYKSARVIGERYNFYYTVWCDNTRDLYDMNVRQAPHLTSFKAPGHSGVCRENLNSGGRYGPKVSPGRDFSSFYVQMSSKSVVFLGEKRTDIKVLSKFLCTSRGAWLCSELANVFIDARELLRIGGQIQLDLLGFLVGWNIVRMKPHLLVGQGIKSHQLDLAQAAIDSAPRPILHSIEAEAGGEGRCCGTGIRLMYRTRSTCAPRDHNLRIVFFRETNHSRTSGKHSYFVFQDVADDYV
ncbi:hypothetical protein B0H17DRAFT_1141557 [Mycena rosella]|uniref:Uncharacterized protein n=1 Tax=Mycena rosella TaxID=1033263 RepID=A0AAD7D0S9_MYCRO|nr:hypothetical protein B0H17DRAFT_1141557 [Mycena rosella]